MMAVLVAVGPEGVAVRLGWGVTVFEVGMGVTGALQAASSRITRKMGNIRFICRLIVLCQQDPYHLSIKLCRHVWIVVKLEETLQHLGGGTAK